MSCAIQKISENQTRVVDVPQFINKFEKLPDDLINKILKFAYPKLDDTFKKSIKIVSTHVKFNLLIKEWLQTKDTQIPGSGDWCDFIKNTDHNMNELFHNLKECGCCERHSTGVYHNSEGEPISHFKDKINGSFTIKKLHNKTTTYNYTYSGSKCICSCRHNMRQVLKCFPVI